MSLFSKISNYFLLLIFFTGDLYSHEIVASKIQIEEYNESNYRISWIRPKLIDSKDIKLSVNSECNSITNYQYQITNENYISSWDVGCNQESLRFIETSDIKNNIEIFVSILSDDEKLIGTLDSNNNKIYLDENNLKVEILGSGMAWLDTGTFDSLQEAGTFIRTLEKRQGLKIGSPEETAWRNKLINDHELIELATKISKNSYGSYLINLVKPKF